MRIESTLHIWVQFSLRTALDIVMQTNYLCHTIRRHMSYLNIVCVFQLNMIWWNVWDGCGEDVMKRRLNRLTVYTDLAVIR